MRIRRIVSRRLICDDLQERALSIVVLTIQIIASKFIENDYRTLGVYCSADMLIILPYGRHIIDLLTI